MKRDASRHFINERGNHISVTITPGPRDDEIVLRVAGPMSESSNLITLEEAHQILDALEQALHQP